MDKALRAAGIALLLVLAVFGVGRITGSYGFSPNYTAARPNATIKSGFTDLCSYVVCEPNKVKCPDGFIASCENRCDNSTGECTYCKPSCEGHLTRSCDNVRCAQTNYTCPDGFVAQCQQSCYRGFCVSCTPDCFGHYKNETPACAPGNRTCPDFYVAECSNTFANGSCTSCAPSCAGHELSHIMFTEVMYDPATSGEKDEWLELYNPLFIGVNLNNWTISDNSGTWKFNNTIIGARSYTVVARNGTAFFESNNCTAHVSGFSRQLNNDGDQLVLKNSDGSEADFVAWKKGADNAFPDWAVAASEGKTLLRINMTDSDSASDWDESAPQPNCF